MSEQQEQTKGYMVELDQWIEENIFSPLLTPAQVKVAIRNKIRESYINGCRSGAGTSGRS